MSIPGLEQLEHVEADILKIAAKYLQGYLKLVGKNDTGATTTMNIHHYGRILGVRSEKLTKKTGRAYYDLPEELLIEINRAGAGYYRIPESMTIPITHQIPEPGIENRLKPKFGPLNNELADVINRANAGETIIKTKEDKLIVDRLKEHYGTFNTTRTT
jgi:hypothetical protein|tara:strand:+ start:287 stop:763 length:477 start_codon:yes stop_codon:yes gene_type:complete